MMADNFNVIQAMLKGRDFLFVTRSKTFAARSAPKDSQAALVPSITLYFSQPCVSSCTSRVVSAPWPARRIELPKKQHAHARTARISPWVPGRVPLCKTRSKANSLRTAEFCLRGVWVAVKELKLSYYIGETPLFTIYTHYGNII